MDNYVYFKLNSYIFNAFSHNRVYKYKLDCNQLSRDVDI